MKQKYGDSGYVETESLSQFLSYTTFAHMEQLMLPPAALRIRETGKRREVFDTFRGKWILLTPEEWVRQHLLHYFTSVLGYAQGRIGVEKSLPGIGRELRTDIVVYDSRGAPALIVEVKASSVPINTSVFAQAAKYNLRLGVPFLAVSNGLVHYCARIDQAAGSYQWMDAFPGIEDIG